MSLACGNSIDLQDGHRLSFGCIRFASWARPIASRCWWALLGPFLLTSLRPSFVEGQTRCWNSFGLGLPWELARRHDDFAIRGSGDEIGIHWRQPLRRLFPRGSLYCWPVLVPASRPALHLGLLRRSSSYLGVFTRSHQAQGHRFLPRWFVKCGIPQLSNFSWFSLGNSAASVWPAASSYHYPNWHQNPTYPFDDQWISSFDSRRPLQDPSLGPSCFRHYCTMIAVWSWDWPARSFWHCDNSYHHCHIDSDYCFAFYYA